MSPSDRQEGAVCRHPECDDDATDTYSDRAGNELALCSTHYFEAVYPNVPRTISYRADDGEDEPRGIMALFQ